MTEVTDPVWCDACLAEISVYDARHVSESRMEVKDGKTDNYRVEFWFCTDACMLAYFHDA